MFLRSLQWRLVSIFILLVVFLIIPIGLFLNKSVESSYYDSFVEEIRSGFNHWSVKEDATLEDMIFYLKDDKNAITLFQIISENRSYSILSRKDASDVKHSSDSLFNSDRDKFINEILMSENLLSVMAGAEEGRSKKPLYTGSGKFLDYARAVSLRDGEYIMYFKLESGAWSNILHSFNQIIISGLLLSIAFALMIGFFLSKAITTPVVKIMHRAQRIASGEFDQVLEVKTEDEIGKLTRAFNFMAKSLKDTLGEIDREKNKVETILNYMTDGIIAFDLKGNMIHNNPASRSILGLSDDKYNYNTFCEKFGIDIQINEMVEKDRQGIIQRTIKSGDRVYNIYFALFSDESKNPEGIIIVLHDITEQARLDNMRKEFVANVSHELRTPLTSIKSYAETLANGSVDDHETSIRFLGVINHEADRMTRIVKDLLELSKFDSQQIKCSMEQLSIKELLNDCIDKLELQASDKNQKITRHIDDTPDITGDRDRLEQVVINILGNAIKYTLDGGSIHVYLTETNNEVELKIRDTGIGIPQKDIPRIFERFYRVDKARSREMGGTGLGLAIAREIVEAHSGIVLINSEAGKGTEVTVRLPASIDKANAV